MLCTWIKFVPDTNFVVSAKGSPSLTINSINNSDQLKYLFVEN